MQGENEGLVRFTPQGKRIALFDSKGSQLGFDLANHLGVEGAFLFSFLCRCSGAFLATLMPTPRTLRLTLDEVRLALFTLPSDAGSRLPPYTANELQILFVIHFIVAVGLDVAWIPVGPFGQLGGFPGTLGTAHVTALFTGSRGSRDKQSIALVARAADSLLDGLIDPLFSGFGGYGQKLLLLLGSLETLPLTILALALLGSGLLLGVAGALLATLVLALSADLFSSEGGSTVVALAVDAHADRPLNTLDTDGLGRSGKPFVRLEGQSVLGEEKAGTLLLQGAAVDLVGSNDGRRGSGGGRDSGLWGWSSFLGGGRGSGGRGCNFLGGFLLLRLNSCWGGGRCGGSSRCGSRSGGFLALEDAAHSLYIFSQAPAPVHVLAVGRPCATWSRHDVDVDVVVVDIAGVAMLMVVEVSVVVGIRSGFHSYPVGEAKGV